MVRIVSLRLQRDKTDNRSPFSSAAPPLLNFACACAARLSACGGAVPGAGRCGSPAAVWGVECGGVGVLTMFEEEVESCGRRRRIGKRGGKRGQANPGEAPTAATHFYKGELVFCCSCPCCTGQHPSYLLRAPTYNLQQHTIPLHAHTASHHRAADAHNPTPPSTPPPSRWP